MTTSHPSLTPAHPNNVTPLVDPPVVPAALDVAAWEDPVVEALGHDPRSLYVEKYWLGVLGPSTVWLIRRVADSLDREPDGFSMPLQQWAQELGIGMRQGKRSPFMRSIDRACQFGLARQVDASNLLVRRQLPPLTQGQLKRLPPELQAEHAQWRKAQLGVSQTSEEDHVARTIAEALLQAGTSVGLVERQLQRGGFDNTVAERALGWATRQAQLPPHSQAAG